MLNFLPQQEKKQLIREYHMRFVILSLVAVAILLIIALVGLLPSYISERTKSNSLEKSRSTLTDTDQGASIEEAESLVVQNGVLAESLSARIVHIKTGISVPEAIKKVFELSGDTIEVVGVEKDVSSMTIRGKATTRDALIAFHQRLKEYDPFSLAILPISDIAKSNNPEFTIRIPLSKTP